MRAVRRKGTACEIAFEAALHKEKLAHSKQVSILKCTPDFVFFSHKVVVFIDGDFWHGRIALEKSRRALYRSFGLSDQRAFWIRKILKNIERDRKQDARLRRHGWSVLRFWEKDLLRDVSAAMSQLGRKLKARHPKRSSGNLSQMRFDCARNDPPQPHGYGVANLPSEH
jgi:DNA mismatch endonuclease (patch repair protein)